MFYVSHIKPANVGALGAEAADEGDAAVRAICESCLVPFLERQLVGASFTDMTSRCAQALFRSQGWKGC